MHQLTITLPPDLWAFVRKAAERDTRPVSLQVRHYVAEAARRAGNPTASLEPWPPPLPVVTGKNLAEMRALVAEWTEERDRLAKREGSTRGDFLAPDEQGRLAWLRNSIKVVQRHIDVIGGRK